MICSVRATLPTVVETSLHWPRVSTSTPDGRRPVRRALVSVHDKTGLEDLARGLAAAGVSLVSTGGSAALIEGLGLAVMEEIIQIDGRIRNASFTDYLLPTMLDMPPVVAALMEEYEPLAPLGAKGVGEPPCISVTPAIVAAIRDALRQAGRDVPLDRVPVRPIDITGV